MGRRSVVVVLALLAACTDLGGLNEDQPTNAGPDGGKVAPGGDDGGSTDGAPNPCEGGLASCGDLCVDTQTDVRHCGRCGRGCLGGACKAGQCQPVELAKGLSIPQGLSQDKSYLYATVYGGNEVIRVAKSDGAVTSISKATSSPFAVAVALDGQGNATQIAWGEEHVSNDAHLNVCSVPCGTPSAISTGASDIRDLVVSGSTLFWAENGSGTGHIKKCTLPGCASPTSIGPSTNEAYGIAAPNAATIVFGQREALGAVTRMGPDGSGVVKLFDADEPQTLASDGTNVYAALNGNAIAKCALTGCIGTNTTLAFAQAPHAVATDGKNVFWGNGLASGGSIAYCPTTGCPGGAVLLAGDQANPYGIVVDDVAVYWASSTPNGSIMKIAKP